MKRIFRRLHRNLYLIPLLLLTADAALNFYEYQSQTLFFGRLLLNSFALLPGWLTVATGVVAWFALRQKKVAFGWYFIHGLMNGIALLLLSALWTNEANQYLNPPTAGLPVILLKYFLIGMLVINTYIGKMQARIKQEREFPKTSCRKTAG
jgi:uncharacterized membrane protein